VPLYKVTHQISSQALILHSGPHCPKLWHQISQMQVLALLRAVSDLEQVL
jgi:hypothetical protein